MIYIYRACKYHHIGFVYSLCKRQKLFVMGTFLFSAYKALCTSAAHLSEILWKKEFGYLSAGFFCYEPCYVKGRAFMTLTVDYYSFHIFTSFLFRKLLFFSVSELLCKLRKLGGVAVKSGKALYCLFGKLGAEPAALVQT